jgi:hypothetical protein
LIEAKTTKDKLAGFFAEGRADLYTGLAWSGVLGNRTHKIAERGSKPLHRPKSGQGEPREAQGSVILAFSAWSRSAIGAM